MATKKKTKSKKTAKPKRDKKRANKGWGQRFTFVKTPKVEPPKESVFGAVYMALRKLRSGTVQEITDEAMKNGLAKYTKQNYRIQTQIKLRRLVRLGAAKKEKDAKPEKEKKVKKEKKSEKTPEKKAPEKKAAPKKAPKAPKAPKAEPVKEDPADDGPEDDKTEESDE